MDNNTSATTGNSGGTLTPVFDAVASSSRDVAAAIREAEFSSYARLTSMTTTATAASSTSDQSLNFVSTSGIESPDTPVASIIPDSTTEFNDELSDDPAAATISASAMSPTEKLLESDATLQTQIKGSAVPDDQLGKGKTLERAPHQISPKKPVLPEPLITKRSVGLQRNLSNILINAGTCTNFLDLLRRGGSIYEGLPRKFPIASPDGKTPEDCRKDFYSPALIPEYLNIAEAERKWKQTRGVQSLVMKDVVCLSNAQTANLAGLQQLKGVWEDPSWWLFQGRMTRNGVFGPWFDAPAPGGRKGDRHTFWLVVNDTESPTGLILTNAECVDIVLEDLGRWSDQIRKFEGWLEGLYEEKQ